MLQMPECVREQPVVFFRANDDAGIHAMLVEPLDAHRHSLQESG